MNVRPTVRTIGTALAVTACLASAPFEIAAQQPKAAQLQVPVDGSKLKNGLKVVLSRHDDADGLCRGSTTTSAFAMSRKTRPASRISSST